MSAQSSHWAMDERPAAADPPRQQRSIFVLRCHDYAESLEAPEILRQRQRDSGTSPRKGRVCHSILREFRDIGNARILNAPNLFRVLFWTRQQSWPGVDAPIVDAIGRTRRAQMRQSAFVFNAAQEQGISILQLYGPCVQNAVDGIGPVLPAEKRIAGRTHKQGMIGACSSYLLPLWDRLRRFIRQDNWIQLKAPISNCRSCAFVALASCISSRAIRNESVDSAPWFSLMRSG